MRETLAAFGQRIATFLIYLNEGYEGGETSFPRIGLNYRAEQGDALFFANVDARRRAPIQDAPCRTAADVGRKVGLLAMDPGSLAGAVNQRGSIPPLCNSSRRRHDAGDG